MTVNMMVVTQNLRYKVHLPPSQLFRCHLMRCASVLLVAFYAGAAEEGVAVAFQDDFYYVLHVDALDDGAPGDLMMMNYTLHSSMEKNQLMR